MTFQRAFMAALFSCASISTASVQLGSIMPLGDSITWGDAWTYTGGTFGVGTGVETPIPGGYRQQFFTNLTSNGYQFQFVGTQTSNSTPTLTAAGQSANEGHPGYFTSTLSAELDASYGGDPGYWMTGTSDKPAIYPNSVLLMAGTNDLINNDNPDYDEYAGLVPLIDHIFALRPTTHVYLSTLIPIPAFPAADAVVKQFNNDITNGISYVNQPGLVAKYAAEGFDLTLVNSYAAFVNPDGSTNASLYFDGLHPNQAGYNVLGNTFAAAVEQSPSTVPEPATFVVVAMGATLLKRRPIARMV